MPRERDDREKSNGSDQLRLHGSEVTNRTIAQRRLAIRSVLLVHTGRRDRMVSEMDGIRIRFVLARDRCSCPKELQRQDQQHQPGELLAHEYDYIESRRGGGVWSEGVLNVAALGIPAKNRLDPRHWEP